jgi:diguanylate cyclase (GGDEF)-like protein
MSKSSQRYAAQFLRRTAIPVAGVMVVAFVLALVLLWRIAAEQDAQARERSVALASVAWQGEVASAVRTLDDYANWGAAYANLHVRLNTEWAYQQSNMGPTLFTRYGFDRVFVVGPNDRTIFAIAKGQLSNEAFEKSASGDVKGLLATAREVGPDETRIVTRLLWIDGQPALFAAGALSTAGDPLVPPIAGPPSVLLFGRLLSPAVLHEMGQRLFLPDLRIARDARDAAAEPRLSLSGGAGQPDFVLRWEPARAGAALLEAVLPWFLIAGGALVAFTVILVHHGLKAAQLVSESSERLAEAYGAAERLALHDLTTGLPNRALLTRAMSDALRDNPGRVAVLFMDLDRFKPVNDAFGHHVGDHVLCEVANRLKDCVGPDELVARIGGDEFVAMIPDGDFDRIGALCSKMLAAVAAPIAIPGESSEVAVGLSIGIALAPAEEVTVEELVRRADIALYAAKEDGRGAYRFFCSTMDDRVLGRRRREEELRRAIADGEFFVDYQPRFDARTMTIRSAEALVRWRHPTRGVVSPGEFIPLAEQTGLIAPLGAWVLRDACVAATRWDGIGVSVNVSPAQFRGEDLIEIVSAALADSGLRPELLEIEVTEGVLLEDVGRARATLASLKEIGVRLAMDDFGTGYSALGYLRNFPFDAIKIDRRFIADLESGGDARAIVQAILGLGRALGLTVTAEGVETTEQLMLLRFDQCDEVQGFLTARPMPPEDIARLMSQDRLALAAGA